MASYAADIKIGVTNLVELKKLDTQLNSVNKKVKEISRGLKFKARVQTIKLDTRAAMTAVRALENRINRLGRTITVNLRTNEQKGKSSGGGTSVGIASVGGQTAASAAAVTTQLKQQQQVLQGLDREEVNRVETADALKELTAKRNDLLKQQEKIYKDIATVENSATKQARTANQNRLFGGKAGRSPAQAMNDARLKAQGMQRAIDATNQSLDRTRQLYGQIAGETYQAGAAERRRQMLVADGFDALERRQKKQLAFRKRMASAGKGAAAGAGIAAFQVPVLGTLAGGALAGGAVGGAPGAVFGAAAAGLVALGGAMGQVAAESVTFNNELRLMQRALANTVSNADEFEYILKAIERASQDFLIPIGEATQQFTKLNAAARASGFSVQEVEEVYRGLASANIALGGDAERLQGILLATQQVFSKGKVQAEELRGQIGERLAGAFAKFAESAGLSTKQLDKALEQGEVTLEQFVAFSRSLLAEYEENALKLGTAPEQAAKRLSLAMDDLKKAMGPITREIGTLFADLATTVVKELTRMINALNQFQLAGKERKVKLYEKGLADIADNLRDAYEARDRGEPLAGLEIAAQEAALKRATDRLRDAKTEYESFRKEVEITFNPTGKPKPTKTSGGDTTKGGKGSKARDRVAELTAELALERQLLEIVNRQTVGSQYQRDLAAEQLKRSELAAELERDKKDVASSNLTTQSKVLANQVLDARYTRELAQLDKERAQFAYDRKRSMDDTVRDLETQLQLESAITEQDRIRIEGAARLAGINRDDYSQDEFDRLTGLTQQITDAQLNNANPLVQYAKGLTAELANTDQMLVDIASTLQTNVAGAFTEVFNGLISGTQSAQQSLANFFKATGEAFIAMAMQIISKQLVMIALQSVLKALGGGGGAPTKAADFQVSDNIGLFSGGFAKGGYPPVGKASVVGEEGPELFVPGQSGLVVPNDIFEATRQALAGGSGGSDKAFADNSDALAVADSYTRERIYERDRQTMITGAGGSTTIQTQVINSVEYATVDQVQKASAQSARQARAQVFADMRNKPATRSSLGMR